MEFMAQLLPNASANEVSALALAGAGGAYVRAIFSPEPRLARRGTEGFAGALGAIFLGGLVGHVLDRLTGAEAYAYFAAGFLMGEGGLAAVQRVRKFIFDKVDK